MISKINKTRCQKKIKPMERLRRASLNTPSIEPAIECNHMCRCVRRRTLLQSKCYNDTKKTSKSNVIEYQNISLKRIVTYK